MLKKQKFSYATQRNIQCNENAQLWYFVNSLQKSQTAKNKVVRFNQRNVANYYLNGNYNNIFGIK